MREASSHESTSKHRGIPDSEYLDVLLQESSARHQHLCPRQVLGVRIGLYGLRLMGFVDEIYQPRFLNADKRLLTIIETDGCGADGVAVATGCRVGRRTLRVLDIGKLAATFVDTTSGRALRVAPSHNSRSLACDLTPDAESRWHAYLASYQILPDNRLLTVQSVRLTSTIEEILSKPEAFAVCDQCGEEIINGREVRRDNLVYCRTCSGDTYYRVEPENN